MNFLIISKYFYPQNRIASFRINAFAKYIRNAGHSVTVIAEGDQDMDTEWNGCKVSYVKNKIITESYLRDKIKRRKRWTVRRITASLLNRIFLDYNLLWGFRVFKKANKLFKENRYDVVLSSYMPISPHLAALNLQSAGHKFFWIADMRDEMSKHPYFSKKYKSAYIAIYERLFLKNADLVLSVSKPILDDFRKMHSSSNYLEVRNGYDYEEVYDVNFQSKFTMGYIGQFYDKIKPDNWFHAFSELISEGRIPKDSIIKIIGNNMKIKIPDNIINNVFEIESVPHDEAIRISTTEVDVLVMIHPLGRKGVYSGKIFDYLATNKPILALYDPDDVVGDLLRETRAGFTVKESDIEGIKSMILKCYSIWKNREVLPRDWNKIKQCRRFNQTKILLDYLSEHLPNQ